MEAVKDLCYLADMECVDGLLDREAQMLELRRPVAVERGQYRFLGRCLHGPNGHTVQLHSSLSGRALIEALKHELRHAWQAERIGNFRTLYRLESERRGYTDNRFERDARAYARGTN